MTDITASVEKAITELRSSFHDCVVEVEADGSGGAYSIVRGIPLGPPYIQFDTWIGFQITFQYPYADVYPHFTQPDLARLDNRVLGEGLGTAQFRNQPALQISRRSNRLDPTTDTATLKLLKVLQWLRTHP
jgi:hypothetical protein